MPAPAPVFSIHAVKAAIWIEIRNPIVLTFQRGGTISPKPLPALVLAIRWSGGIQPTFEPINRSSDRRLPKQASRASGPGGGESKGGCCVISWAKNHLTHPAVTVLLTFPVLLGLKLPAMCEGYRRLRPAQGGMA
jgi:hypothetical protein